MNLNKKSWKFWLFFLLIAACLPKNTVWTLSSPPDSPSENQTVEEESDEEPFGGTVRVLIPAAWINKLYNFGYTQNSSEIIKEFTEIINFGYMEKKEAIIFEIDRYAGWYINPIIANIDEDKNQEILALYGATERTPILLVFKQIENNWYLLYYEPFYIKYDNPELCVANNYSANKTFYVRCIHGSGSGILHNVYHFYKLINGKVYPCLTLLHEANIDGWGLLLNQRTTADFSFNSMNADSLWVDYRYNFYPGPIYEDDVPWDSHDDISFVTGTGSVKYIWDDSTKQYIPDYYDRPDDLTTEKIECFEDFGNDELFIKAFDYEINKTLEEGTEEQKKILTWYLETVKNRSQ